MSVRAVLGWVHRGFSEGCGSTVQCPHHMPIFRCRSCRKRINSRTKKRYGCTKSTADCSADPATSAVEITASHACRTSRALAMDEASDATGTQASPRSGVAAAASIKLIRRSHSVSGAVMSPRSAFSSGVPVEVDAALTRLSRALRATPRIMTMRIRPPSPRAFTAAAWSAATFAGAFVLATQRSVLVSNSAKTTISAGCTCSLAVVCTSTRASRTSGNHAVGTATAFRAAATRELNSSFPPISSCSVTARM
mmetsp:Transcript_20601/g.53564  ORF Transcript_20601/g.53564 Transcript_20601/m.53564 type:complete len:252 (+) Transcript_20601:81-836(+)